MYYKVLVILSLCENLPYIIIIIMINIYCKVCRDCFMCANYIEIACLAGQGVRKRAYMCTVHKLFVCLLIKFVRA